MTAQFVRLKPRSGAVVNITIDGRHATAQAGDTLMTAMLLSGAVLRRFEFGEATRAGFCLMSACQDCWVTLDDGQRLRACSTLVAEGMAVRTGTVDG
ncbi:MAG: (2Fe-2S)-binding protein [Alphaproteobacteria bacterium]|nr:(2Fe-2S)-binding protein [Alphaproteobacteria bacterium]